SGPTCRAKRPNTWLHRPMLHTFKKVLANSEPSTHGGKADIAFRGSPLSWLLLGAKRTLRCALHMSASDPKRTWRPVPGSPSSVYRRHCSAIDLDQWSVAGGF